MKSPTIQLQRIKKQYKIFPYKFKIEGNKYYMYLDRDELSYELNKLDYSNLEHDTEYLIMSMQENSVNSVQIKSGQAHLVRVAEDTGEVETLNLGDSIKSKDRLLELLGMA